MRSVDRSQDGRDAGRVLERGAETAAILASKPGGAAGAGVVECLHGVVHVCGEPSDRRIPRADAFCEQTPQVVEALTRLGRDDNERCVSNSVRGQKTRDVGTPGVKVSRRQKIRLVQNDRHRLPVRGERAQVPVVQRCVSVLLRLHDPGDEVGESDDAVDLEPVRGLDRVEVGEVEQHKAVEAVGGEPVAAWDLQPVEERIRAVAPDGSLPSGRRRAAAADSRERLPGECVEELRFSGAGRAGESHDRRLEPKAQPRPRLRDDGTGPLDGLPVEPSLR